MVPVLAGDPFILNIVLVLLFVLFIVFLLYLKIKNAAAGCRT